MKKILFVLLLVIPVFAYCDVYRFTSSRMRYGESDGNNDNLVMSPWKSYRHYITVDLTNEIIHIKSKKDNITLKILKMDIPDGEIWSDGIYRETFSFTVMDQNCNTTVIDVCMTDTSDIAYLVLYYPNGLLVYHMKKIT